MVKFYLQQLLWPKFRLNKILTKTICNEIAQSISEAEKGHQGEIKVFFEAHVPLMYARKSIHARARELFATEHVWDTEHNSGILIYILFSSRTVDIIVDRNIPASEMILEGWIRHFAEVAASSGVVNATKKLIEEIGVFCRSIAPLASDDDSKNELDNAPKML